MRVIAALARAAWLVPVAMSFNGTRALAQQQPAVPPALEQGVFELAVRDLPARTLLALVTPSGAVLLPLRETFTALGYPYEADGSRLSVPRPDASGSHAVLDLAARTLLADSLVRLAPLELVDAGGVAYLAAPRLAELLAAKVEVDMGTLSISITRETLFPVQLRLQLERRRRGLDARTRAREERDAAVPFDPTHGGAVVEWNVGGIASAHGVPSHASLGTGAELAGGMLRLTGTAYPSTAPGVPSSGDASASFHRVFPQRRWLRQLQVGDVVTEGPLARSVRGVTVTNAPFVRGMRFGELPFSQQLPRGWEYEVYQGGQLIGFATSQSDGPVLVPINYGSTPVEVRLYGPAGEITTSKAVFAVPVEQLRGGEWQYATGAGRCPRSQCDLLWYGELRHGITHTLTVQGGADQLMDSVSSAFTPYGAISWLPAPAWGVELQARQGSYAKAMVQNLEPGALSGSASFGVSAGHAIAPGALATPSRWFGDLSLQTDVLQQLLRGRSVGFSARMEGARGSGAERWNVSTTLPVPGGHLGIGARDDPYAVLTGDRVGQPMFSVDPFWVWSRGSPKMLGTPVLRGSLGILRSRVREWEAGFSLQPRFGSVNISARRSPGISTTQLTLSITQFLPHARATAHVTQRGRRFDGGYGISGGLAFESAARAHPLVSGGLGLAGVRGRVYRDVDGDGAFSPGDEPMPDAMLSVGSVRVVTDSMGRYHTWSVLPYEVTRVVLDTATISDPMWVPGTTETVLRLSPHRYNVVDFPMLVTREVAGAVVAERGVATASGLTIEITSPGADRDQRTVTYSDGGFYIGRLRPGDYELRVATSSLEALDAVSFPERVPFTIPASGAVPVVELPPLRLRKLGGAPELTVTTTAPQCAPAPAGVRVDARGCAVLFAEERTITLRGVTFASGRAALTPASVAGLEPVVAALLADTSLVIEVAGHTDSTGSRARNLALSAARADAVRAFFISRGVRAERMVSRGYGPDQPVAPNDSPDGRSLNRRTELRRLDRIPPAGAAGTAPRP